MKILASFAHPDDESYGPAGILAQATRNGHIVSLLTLTHGESGTLGISKNLSAIKLAKLRKQELKCAAKKLGIQHLHIHNFPDKNLAETPKQDGIEIIYNKIQSFKPDIVITYHENTISGHPDHRIVTDWTYTAIKSKKSPPKLFYYGLNKEQTSMISYGNLLPIQTKDITHKVNIENYINKKIAAIQCHKTQISAWQEIIKSGIDPYILFRWECFVQKWPVSEFNSIKHNLFEN